MLSFKPASNGNINMMQYLYDTKGRTNLYVTGLSDPYILNKNVKGLTPRFYDNIKVRVQELSDVSLLKELGDNDLVIMHELNQDNIFKEMEREGFIIEKRSIPRWIATLDQLYKVCPDYNHIFVLYSKQDIEKTLSSD